MIMSPCAFISDPLVRSALVNVLFPVKLLFPASVTSAVISEVKANVPADEGRVNAVLLSILIVGAMRVLFSKSCAVVRSTTSDMFLLNCIVPPAAEVVKNLLTGCPVVFTFVLIFA